VEAKLRQAIRFGRGKREISLLAAERHADNGFRDSAP